VFFELAAATIPKGGVGTLCALCGVTMEYRNHFGIGSRLMAAFSALPLMLKA